MNSWFATLYHVAKTTHTACTELEPVRFRAIAKAIWGTGQTFCCTSGNNTVFFVLCPVQKKY